MSRPFKCRRVCFVPGVTYFKPAGIPLRTLAENCLTLEEVEAIRLRDLEHLEQAECAGNMNVSRPTFQRVLASARRKIADGLLHGKALKIEGGNYEFAADQASAIKPGLKIGGKMKIAVASDDGKTISQHFGRATQYVVVNAEDGKTVSRETRPKAGHNQFAAAGPHGQGCGDEVHGYGAQAGSRHAAMARNILDCSVLLAGGMGWGAYESLKSNNIEPIVTDVKDIEEAVRLYLEGKLPNLMERLH